MRTLQDKMNDAMRLGDALIEGGYENRAIEVCTFLSFSSTFCREDNREINLTSACYNSETKQFTIDTKPIKEAAGSPLPIGNFIVNEEKT